MHAGRTPPPAPGRDAHVPRKKRVIANDYPSASPSDDTKVESAEPSSRPTGPQQTSLLGLLMSFTGIFVVQLLPSSWMLVLHVV